MEASSVLNQLGTHVVVEDTNRDWSSQYFWDFLTKPERLEPRSLATYEETQVTNKMYSQTNDHTINLGFVNNFQDSKVAYEETRVDDNPDTHFVNNIEMNTYYDNDFEVPDDPEVNHFSMDDFEVPDDPKVNHEPDVREDYEQFVKAMERRDRTMIREFIESHPRALTLKLFPRGRTALHYASRFMDVETVKYLVGHMEAKDLEIMDEDEYTALALAAKYDHPRIEELLESMLEKNPDLIEIGSLYNIPIIVASGTGAKRATRFLFRHIDTKILMKDYDLVGVRLLINCIYYKYFDIAMVLVRYKPKILLTRDEPYEGYPIKALAEALNDFPKGTIGNNKSSSGDSLFGCLRPPSGDEVIFNERINHDEIRQAREFLELIYDEVGKYTKQELKIAVHEAMISATRNGTVDFIDRMLKANKNLIWAKDDEGKGLFLKAIEYRQEEVFCLIYQYGRYTDLLLEMPEKESGNNNDNDNNGNVLHLISKLPEEGYNGDENVVRLLAKLPEEDNGGNVLHLVAHFDPQLADSDSISSFLQMQREVQWFKGVADLVKDRYRFDPNDKGVMPNYVFTKNHEPLVAVGMKSMKDLATAASVVGGLIVTAMFAALFTAPGGNDQNTGYPLYISESSFKFFVIFDALSLFSSTTSVLLFLGILTSRYSAKDFDRRLPRKLLNGFATLFFSITTMMLSFCTALVIMFKGRLLFIAPIVLLSTVPIVFFSRSVCPLLHEIYVSTYRPSIFERNYKKMMEVNQMERDDIYYLPDEEDGKMMSYSYIVD